MFMPYYSKKVQEDKLNEIQVKYIEVIKFKRIQLIIIKFWLKIFLICKILLISQFKRKNEDLDFDIDFIQQLDQIVNFKSYCKKDALKELEDSNIYDLI
ncbi:unnamed protein product [Paramecium sonneborni]|uniref:Uncharacterized protein n=1 Tax=Paramecium sonneborni TaxID=65129 RepID=A0A8S1R4C0_9CILI|nr:unnamed protein product [Paramecium sonneborni]